MREYHIILGADLIYHANSATQLNSLSTLLRRILDARRRPGSANARVQHDKPLSLLLVHKRRHTELDHALESMLRDFGCMCPIISRALSELECAHCKSTGLTSSCPHAVSTVGIPIEALHPKYCSPSVVVYLGQMQL